MPSTLTDVGRSVAPIWEIFNRLTYHSEAGSNRVIEDATFDREALLDITERKKLPIIQPKFFTINEEIFPGASDSNSTPGTTPVAPLISFELWISTYRENGWLQFNPDAELSYDIKDMGAMELTFRVMDAIELTAEASPVRDSLLNGYLAKPIEFAVADASDVTDLTWLTKLDVSLFLHPLCRGSRSSLKT